MNKIINILLLCLIFSNAYGQTKETTPKNSIPLKESKKPTNIPKTGKENNLKNFQYEVDSDLLPISLIFSPCMNFIWNKSGDANNKKTGFFGSTNLVRLTFLYDLQIAKSNFFVSFGLGWTHQDFQFQDQYALYKKPGGKVKFVKGDEVVYNTLNASDEQKANLKVKNANLYTKYLEGTLEFQFRQNRKYYKEGFFTTLGTKVGYCFVNPETSIYYHDGNDNNELKRILIKEGLGIKAFKWSAIFRIGYGIVGVFLEWTFTNLFNTDKFENDISMKPCSAGITIDFF